MNLPPPASRLSGIVLIVLAFPLAGAVAGEESTPEPPAAKRFQGRSDYFETLPPRTERTAEERQLRAAELRELYAKPPGEWPAPLIDENATWKELGPLPAPVHPETNPSSKAKVALGRQLFFDPRLSATSEMACASCHDPDLGWSDGRAVSFGLHRQALKRNSPGVLNAVFQEKFFWDGRAGSLEDQARQVLQNPQEMGSSESLLKERLADPEYQMAFAEVFGDPAVTIDRVAQALACFERTLVGGRSRFDAFLKGKSAALSDSALLGLDLFRREARCLHCHNGPMLTDGQFHDIGLSYYGRKFQDLGRHGVTQSAEDVGRFRTPTLRNITATRPYMHNGLFELEGVLNMYNSGMPTLTPKPDQVDDPLFPNKKSLLLRPLGLNRQDLTDLEAFLKSLEEPRSRIRPPRLPGEPQPAPGDQPASEPAETANR